MKREMSDTDSEQDLLDDACASPMHHSGMDRKKRRGIIEKRRRDRINHSLTELKRLVPAAYEKQGSAKLEKAEILQMTVDHLKILQQQKSFGYHDPSAIAMDYRTIGFRECAGEVARYLMSVEGLDSHDPLRLRLLSHLQCFSHQRENELAKSRMAAAGGGAVPPPGAWVAAAATGGATPGATAATPGYSAPAGATPVAFVTDPLSQGPPPGPPPQQAVPSQFPAGHAPPHAPPASTHLVHSSQQLPPHPSCSPSFLSAQQVGGGGGAAMHQPGHQFAGMTHSSQYHPNGLQHMGPGQQPGGASKPYRPWGTELGAY